MTKEKTHNYRGFSDIRLNMDVVRSFIKDVGAQDKLSKSEIEEIFSKPGSKPEEKKESKSINHNKQSSTIKSVKVPDNQSDSYQQKKYKESLTNIVEALVSCAKARRGLNLYPTARMRCMKNGEYETYWFLLKAYNMYDLPDLRKCGNFVPQYSEFAVKLQKTELGKSFTYEAIDNIKKLRTYDVILENRSNLQNNTIEIAGDDLTYQYRNIHDFLNILRENQEDIEDVETKIEELKKRAYELAGKKNAAYEKGQITKTINSYQKAYRILTQQEEDLKNITIYIRKQGEMRYSHIVDPIQTGIMSQNRFDGKTIIIEGGPGTGKTTTMIHRLSYLTDNYAINEDEKKGYNNYKLDHQQRLQLFQATKDNRDWMFFSPSQLLRDYLSDAMRQEGLNNTSEKVLNWRDYCRKILQEYYHILEMKGSNAPFKVCYISDALFHSNSDIIQVFTNFYLGELRGIKSQLPKLDVEGKVYVWKSIAQNIQKRIEESDNYDLSHFISLFISLESVYGEDCKNILKDRNEAIIELSNDICARLENKPETKSDIEEILKLSSEENYDISEDENDNEKEDEKEDEKGNILGMLKNLAKPLFNRKNNVDKFSDEIQKWLKAYCTSKANDAKELTEEQLLVTEYILPELEGKYDDKIQKITDLMVFEQFAQYTRGIRGIMLSGLPARYRRFRSFLIKSKYEGCNLNLLRDIMRRQQGKELHHQEQSLLLGFINTLVKQIKATTTSKIRHDYIEAYEYVARPIIGIDEATDFSICDIYAMQSLLTLDFNSLSLCGDFMQSMTDYGIQSWNELKSIIPNYEVKKMKTSYRQSKKLLEVARQLYADTMNEIPNYRAYMKSNVVPDPLVYINENEHSKIEWISKRMSEVYRAYGNRLPSVAIFVNDKGYITRFIEGLQSTEFLTNNHIKVVDGTDEVKKPENHICVYPIDKVKGMEFDVVFFHNIEYSSKEPEMVKRYIYVGISRAAFFLGITMSTEDKGISKYFVQNKDWFKIS